MKSDKHGASIENHEDGSKTVRTAGGGVIEIGTDKNVTLSLETIEAVGIHNLIEVESHQIARVAGSTSHYIRFHGGGEVRFAYNTKGELIELSAQNCAFSLTNANELVLRKPTKKA